MTQLGDDITIEGAARLIAALIFTAAVEREALGTGLWNYGFRQAS